MQIVGAVMAALGIWLGISGGFGEVRLRAWETGLRDWIQSGAIFSTVFSGANWVRHQSDGARGQVLSSFGSYARAIAIMLIILSALGAIGAGITSGSAMIIGIVAVGSLVAFLFLLPVAVYIVSALFALVIWLMMLPYLLLDRLAARIRFQGTLLIVGAIFGTVGIVLSLVG